ncbi:MAG: CehA/McbA family metallohydrolase [Nannocystales bacterium]
MLLLSACTTPSPPLDPVEARAPSKVDSAAPPKLPPGWLKGQLHLHSDASGDSETPAADVVRWYRDHAYDFIVFTDHNRVTEAPSPSGMLVLPGVELTQNLERCSPPPQAGHQCLLHVNALVVDPTQVKQAATLDVPHSDERVEIFAHGLHLAESLGGLAQLNHPNFHYAANAQQLSALVDRGLTLFEVANEAWDSNNEGDSTHPSTEALWDSVLSGGRRLYGTATDDAHHYYDAAARDEAGEPVFTGDVGFVVVRAERTPHAIRDALRAGEFYASTGVFLEDVSFDGGVLEVRGTDSLSIAFIADGGERVQTVPGPHARYDTRGKGHSYIRAVVTDQDGRRAWVQPVFLTNPA